jgi:hypothetical protein
MLSFRRLRDPSEGPIITLDGKAAKMTAAGRSQAGEKSLAPTLLTMTFALPGKPGSFRRAGLFSQLPGVGRVF